LIIVESSHLMNYFAEVIKFPLKGRVQYFSVQVVMNKCFLLNPEKNWHKSTLSFSEKNAQTAHFNSDK